MKKVISSEMRAVEGGAPFGVVSGTCRSCGVKFYSKMIWFSYSAYSAALNAIPGAFKKHVSNTCPLGGKKGYTVKMLNW